MQFQAFQIKVYSFQVTEKPVDFFRGGLEAFDQEAAEVIDLKGAGYIKLGIVQTYPGELDDRIGDFLIPVFAAALLHPVGKSMERNIKNMPAPALEAGGQSPEISVLFEEQNPAAPLTQLVGTG